MSVGKSWLGFVGLTCLSTFCARTHRSEEVAAWLQDAGFGDVTRSPIHNGGPGNVFVQASKPEEAR